MFWYAWVFVFFNLSIENRIKVLHFPEQDPTAEMFVQQLGNNKYTKREEAARILHKMDMAAIEAITNHLNDDDPEIRYRCRYLLSDITDFERFYENFDTGVSSSEKYFPSIWDLSNSLRYDWDRDIALEYYNEAWERMLENNNYGYFILVYNKHVVCRRAAFNYISDLRKKGLTKEGALELVQSMKINKEQFRHDKREDDEIPSPLLIKSSINGMKYYNVLGFGGVLLD